MNGICVIKHPRAEPDLKCAYSCLSCKDEGEAPNATTLSIPWVPSNFTGRCQRHNKNEIQIESSISSDSVGAMLSSMARQELEALSHLHTSQSTALDNGRSIVGTP